MIIRVFRALYNGLDATRRLCANILFALFLLMVVVIVMLAMSSPSVPEGAILAVDIRGQLVMSPSELGVGRRWLSRVTGKAAEQTAISDVTDALRAAEEDKRIRAVLLRLDSFTSAGPAAIQEIGKAVTAFQKSGRKVYTWSDAYSQARWAIAAYADEIYLHPMGGVEIKGLESTTLYWGDVLKKLGVNVHVVKAGAYKSAPEVFTQTGPSKESVEAQREWMQDEWSQLTGELETARQIPAGSIREWIQGYLRALAAHEGDAAQTALDAKMVTGLAGWEALREHLTSKKCMQTGCKEEFIGYKDYLSLMDVSGSSSADKIAVVTVEGEITDGTAAPREASAEKVISEIRQAISDNSVKALLLQINSPGGSAMASEKIREALVIFRETGRPVVAYLGDTAASGGYWVATAAQKIIANPMSVTGSIGVFGVVPTFEKVLSKTGVGLHQYKTEEAGISSSLLQPLSEDAAESARLQVQDTYRKFLQRVSDARGISVEKVDSAGQGRVWTGRQAKKLQLVDELGCFEDAVDATAVLAGLDGDFSLKYMTQPVTENLMEVLLDGVLTNSGVPESVRGAMRTLFGDRPEKAATPVRAGIQARSLWDLTL